MAVKSFDPLASLCCVVRVPKGSDGVFYLNLFDLNRLFSKFESVSVPANRRANGRRFAQPNSSFIIRGTSQTSGSGYT